ncbi:Na+/H+ antiporter family protein [Amphritea balenae]|uniref:TRAP transporter large permease subunit n=1 Tax=Amphritea balenae TaxID=452629 RepID=A0A3P1SJG9_9GAMM|nr:Na+/H+ antiporter NhaC family protein [Amphritea balenae]RRC97206.1 TRAP transporter large permease subunit [Amphritea balenae]GGK64155.1 transporter [Amphritea balenae]
MNAVIVGVLTMLVLSLLRTHVVMALLIGAMAAGLAGGLGLEGSIAAFNDGIGGGASVALSYALLGGFAVAISQSGLPHALADKVILMLGREHNPRRVELVKNLLLLMIMLVAISSQNVMPIHIAFIPLLIPPLLLVMSKMQLDRRLVACVLTFGLVTPYMFLPVGFGGIFLNEILLKNITTSGLDVTGISVIEAMGIPALGMLSGLLIAVFISYRGKRQYNVDQIAATEHAAIQYDGKRILLALLAIGVAFVTQLYTGSMVMGALLGFILFSVTGVVRWNESDDLLTDGMKMMAMIGFIMIAAGGFAQVLRETGEIATLVSSSVEIIGQNKALAAFLMLLVGLLITMGIGSSFSTIPIIASIYVPLAMELGFTPLAIVALVGTAAALGDAGSPASDSTLGPTSGLNVDGQHNHIWDTVVPTFVHYNLPLLAAGWVAAVIL